MTFGSLFAGIGGMDLGLERAGMECRWQVEIDPFCTKVLEKHWPGVKRYGDIRLVEDELERVDLIAGGFPCQPVSQAGHRLIQDDERWLWPEFIRIARLVRPRGVLLENVPGLLNGGGMSEVLGDLAASGYDAEWQSIPAASLGAPHIRDRVWIFAYPGQVSREPETGNGYGRERSSMFLEGGDRPQAERIKNRELVALVPGIDSGVVTDWWRSQSRVDRTAHGIPFRVERNCAYGNAVVPQVAEWIGRRIIESL